MASAGTQSDRRKDKLYSPKAADDQMMSTDQTHEIEFDRITAYLTKMKVYIKSGSISV